MKDVKQNKVSRFTANVISVIVALLLSGIATIIAGLLLQDKESGWFAVATILIGLATGALTFGISQIIIGAIHKYKLSLAISAFLLFFALAFVLGALAIFGAKWRLLLIIALVFLPIPALAIILVYRKNMVLVMDNEKPDYKDYKTHEEEKKLNKEEKEEPLPEIKSFK